MKLGIIGAENSHTAAIAKELNVEKAIPGFQVTHVWGETDEFAKAAAEAGQIPTIVAQPQDMLGQVDCVMVDHRNGKYHLEAVTPFVEAGFPVFVDKPMSTSLEEAKAFLRLRREKGVAVTTMSAIPHQASVGGIRQRLVSIGDVKAVHLNGPGDPDSEHGGVFFYGIHQVDLMVELFGVGAAEVSTARNGAAFTGLVSYPDGLTVSIGMAGAKGFSVAAVGTEGGFHEPVVTDANTYLATSKLFTGMFETGVEPFGEDRMLAPIAILEALQQSLNAGEPKAVPGLEV